MATVFDCRIKAGQVTRIAAITYRQLDYWIREGLLGCAVPAQGKGSERGFAFLDVIRIRVIGNLRTHDVTLQEIRKALDILAKQWREHDPLASGRLLAIDGKVYWAESDASVIHILSGQSAMRRVIMIDVGELARETKAKVQALCEAA